MGRGVWGERLAGECMARQTPTVNVQEWGEGDVILGVYEVRRLIARGGMGQVYLVHHRGWDLDLAVKCPKPEVIASEKGARLFEQECETWVNLGLHPNIASCYYVRRIDDIPHVFAEYVDGGTLSTWIHKRLLYRPDVALKRILDVALQFAWGLRYAHAQSLLHQDVKPLNVLMTTDGVAKVTDFGLSRAMNLASSEGEVGVRAHRGIGSRGTPAYCSPEQAHRRKLTFATDIWSWAVSTLEMFVGDVTWMAGQSAGQALEHYLVLGPEYEAIPEMPPKLVDLLRWCFEEDPADRPPGMGDVIESLVATYLHEIREPYFRETPEAEDTSADRMNNRAISMLDLGKKTEAQQTWERALRIEPGHLESTYNYLLQAWRAGATTDRTVIRAMKRLWRKNPKSWTAVYMLAQVEMERGDYATAKELLARLKAKRIDGHEVDTAAEEAERRVEESRCLLKSFGTHEGEIAALSISWDGRLAFSADSPKQGGPIIVWDVASGERVNLFKGHRAAVSSLAVAAHGIHMASGSLDRTARVWNVATGDCVRTFDGHTNAVTGVQFTDDGQGLLTASADGSIGWWDLNTGRLRTTFAGHEGPVNAICLGVSGQSFFSAGQDGTLRQWELLTGRCIRVDSGYPAPFLSMAVSDNRRYLLAGTADGFIELYDIGATKKMGRRNAHSEPVTSIVMGRRGAFAISGVRGGKLRIWQMALNRCLHTFTGRSPLALSGDGKVALSAGEDGALMLWHVGFNSDVTPAPMMLCQSYRVEEEPDEISVDEDDDD